MDSGWEPANEVEREMHAALQRGDGAGYAAAVRSARLYEPTLSDADPAGLPPLDEDHALVFTSPVTLFWVLGRRARGYTECNVDSLRERRPVISRLVINPGVPIAAMLSLSDVDDVAEGKQDLVSVEDAQGAVVDEVLAEVRRMCLTLLGVEEGTARGALETITPNALEDRLGRAVAGLDFDEFLQGLLEGDVVVLTGAAEGGRSASGFRALGGPDSPVLPVFSSETLLDHLVPAGMPRRRVPFQALVRDWPDEDHVLCFNPGTTTELILPGNSVPELSVAYVDDTAPPRGS